MGPRVAEKVTPVTALPFPRNPPLASSDAHLLEGLAARAPPNTPARTDPKALAFRTGMLQAGRPSRVAPHPSQVARTAQPPPPQLTTQGHSPQGDPGSLFTHLSKTK